MHDIEPDLVSIKTAVRQLAARLEGEAASAAQWSSLAKHRGVPRASDLLASVSASLEEASRQALSAADALLDAQEGHRH